MRNVRVAPLDREVSAIGFGCASLRLACLAECRAQSVWTTPSIFGVTWYDVAPPYGDGAAEDILGGFLRGPSGRRLSSARSLASLVPSFRFTVAFCVQWRGGRLAWASAASDGKPRPAGRQADAN